MTDLFDEDSAAMFRNAMRDVADTFDRKPVTLLPAAGGSVELLAGVKESGDGQSTTNGELVSRERGEETVERYTVKFNRDYLAEKGLVDADDKLLITIDDKLEIDGRRFVLEALSDKAIFRGKALNVVMEAVR